MSNFDKVAWSYVLKAIYTQRNRTEKLCNRADTACQVLTRLVAPFFHEDIRDDLNIFDQHGDGLVLEYNGHNYTIDSVIDAIRDGENDIDLRLDVSFLNLI